VRAHAIDLVKIQLRANDLVSSAGCLSHNLPVRINEVAAAEELAKDGIDAEVAEEAEAARAVRVADFGRGATAGLPAAARAARPMGCAPASRPTRIGPRPRWRGCCAPGWCRSCRRTRSGPPVRRWRGGERSLLLGETFPSIKAVAAYVPSHVVWGGFGQDGDEQSAGWTYRGEAITAMPPADPADVAPDVAPGEPIACATY